MTGASIIWTNAGSRKKPELKELEKDHFCACHLTEAEKVMKKAEIDGKPVKKAQRAVIGDEICLDVKDVRNIFPIYKGMMRKHIGDVKAIEDISFKVKKRRDIRNRRGVWIVEKQHWQDALCVCVSAGYR